MMLGLSLPALRVAGGFVLLLAAIPMVTQYQRSDEQEAEVFEAASAEERQLGTAGRRRRRPFQLRSACATVAAAIAATGNKPSLTRALATTVLSLLMSGVVWLDARLGDPADATDRALRSRR